MSNLCNKIWHLYVVRALDQIENFQIRFISALVQIYHTNYLLNTLWNMLSISISVSQFFTVSL